MAKGEGATGAMAPVSFCNSFSQFNDDFSLYYNPTFQIMCVAIYQNNVQRRQFNKSRNKTKSQDSSDYEIQVRIALCFL